MAELIADTYEILQRIGSGGGGVVYLGYHTRLNKTIVLKADKRTLSASPDSLRREVDILKSLTQTYIPQVYDFVYQDGVVYTVMDYIQGESLDKILERGQPIPQFQVVEWACELLEALVYLHSQPPHGILHGDIKPANVMLTPGGDIRLIDFNIALALGEEGAIRVGYSLGYASPEHYSADLSTFTQSSDVPTDEPTDPEKTVSMKKGSSSKGSKGVLVDVRSDIYSLGATLYHLLAGVRPARHAEDVVPLNEEQASPLVSEILCKSMAVNPADRYQTAEEMLWDFRHLHENDRRTKNLKRGSWISAAAMIAIFLAGGFLTFTGLRQEERLQNAYTVSEYSANALAGGDVDAAVAYALEALPAERGWFDPPYTAEAQLALTNALGVYQQSSGFYDLRTIPLESEPLKLRLSPEGRYLAVLTLGKVNVFDTESGEPLASLPAVDSAAVEILFYGEDVLYYAGDTGLVCYDLQTLRPRWTGRPATSIALSGDGSTVAGLYRDENFATVYDAGSGTELLIVDFAGRTQWVQAHDQFAYVQRNIFALNNTGIWLAVSFSDGGLFIYNLQDAEEDVEIYDSSEYYGFEGGFSGKYFGFSALREGEALLAFIDMEELVSSGGGVSDSEYHVVAGEDGLYVANGRTLVQFDTGDGSQTEKAYVDADIDEFNVDSRYILVHTTEGNYFLFDHYANLLESFTLENRIDFIALAGEYMALANHDETSVRIRKEDLKRDTLFFQYEPDYRHDEARISDDGKTVMLFRYDGFRLYALDGTILADVRFPNPEQVYDTQYIREETGSYLELTDNDGLVRTYSAATGELLTETQTAAPDSSLTEEFLTDRWRIVAPLHGAPQVYSRESGALMTELAMDGYLTYVEQVGDFLVAFFRVGEREAEYYGLLLDEKMNILARLPDLCDVFPDGRLFFDDHKGTLRQSRLYSIGELMDIAGQREKGGE